MLASFDGVESTLTGTDIHHSGGTWDELIGIVDRRSIRNPLVRGPISESTRSRKTVRNSGAHFGEEKSLR